MEYTRPGLLHYRLAQVVSWFVATFLFQRKILRNEIKGKKGAFVVIANHQAAYDFVNLIGTTARPMSFVISNSFYNSLPITGFLKKMGVIPKQQFQTSIKDMKRMKAVINAGQPLVIYPAGLMCEDGLSTPIPAATYKFLKWLGADVYVARTSGTYFVMPKWAGKVRPGRTHLDIFKLFSKEELEQMDVDAIRGKTDEALLFDAYREQETMLARYRGGSNVEGLEQVLYMCPRCKAEFSVRAEQGRVLRCIHCGFEHTSDAYGFLHGQPGEELRYVSDWSRMIYRETRERVCRGEENGMTASTRIHMIDYRKHRFVDVGQGRISLNRDGFALEGEVNGRPASLTVSVSAVPTLPFKPGKYLELQQGGDIYRCVLEDGQLVMKYINLLKIFRELKCAAEG